jgi:hypothetical protein
MNEAPTSRRPLSTPAAPPGDRLPLPAPRIQVDVPMGTPYQEIQDSIFLQAYRLAGTPLRAAIALGIAPDTVSRVVGRYVGRPVGPLRVPQAWPGVECGQRGAGKVCATHDGVNPTLRLATGPRSVSGNGLEAGAPGRTYNKDTGPDE